MHHLGVSTTRALSLIASPTHIGRPWYSAGFKEDRSGIPTSVNDPRLARWPKEYRKEVLEQVT